MNGYHATVDGAVELLHLFGDATRVRLMALLAKDELAVAELTTITELPQSRVSTHLGRLKDAGLLRDRKVGASTYYALNDGAMPEAARKVWELVESQVADAVLEADRARCEKLKRAAKRGASWPDSIAGEMERHYSPGRTWEATARGLLGFVKLGDVLDVGGGDGAIAALLAPRAESITLLDHSERMVEAAEKRLSKLGNARVVKGEMAALPFERESFDQVLLLNTLSYAEEPKLALAEAARVLRPRGTLALVTLAQHSNAEVTQAYGHLHAGFELRTLRRWLEAAGLFVRESGITSRERKKPYFEVITAFAEKRASNGRKNHG
jgi:ArsR family transcriptional regulator